MGGAEIIKESALPKDSEKRSIQVGSFDRYTDDNAVFSPLAVAGTALELKPPKGALSLIIKPRTDAVQHSRAEAMTNRAVLEVGVHIALSVADGSSVWVRQETGALTLDFWFVMV